MVTLAILFSALTACSVPTQDAPNPHASARFLGTHAGLPTPHAGAHHGIAEGEGLGVLSPLAGQSLRDLPSLRGPPPPPDSDVFDFLEPISGAAPNYDIGLELDALMDTKSSSLVASYGVGVLTPEELWGTEEHDYEDGLCLDPEILFQFREDSVDYEANLMMPGWFHFLGEVERYWIALNPSCEDALEANGGDIDAAVAAGDCLDTEQESLFPEGSECRACLDETGDLAACFESERCEEIVQARFWVEEDGQQVWYDAMFATLWACAPDWMVPIYLLGHNTDEGELPGPWGHEDWAYMCFPAFNEEEDSVWWYCADGEGGPKLGGTVGEGALGYVRHIRIQGTDGDDWFARGWYAQEVEINGWILDRYWAWNPGIGAVSSPIPYWDSNGDGEVGPGDYGWGYPLGYWWGQNPKEDRPDGESKARDFIATDILKSSTTISGIWVSAANHNRCSEGAWVDAGDDTWHCEAIDEPTGGWMNDVGVEWSDADWTVPYQYPMNTIASTGLPDPMVPGGYVIDLASSEPLAMPAWEGCTHPHTFEPDTTVCDVTPADQRGTGGLVGHTWRFDKDDSDIRVIMNTNQWRGYCPEGSEGYEPGNFPL